jgi:hypothetical protein
MGFSKDKRDRSLIRLDKERIWLANGTSDAHVALAWAEVVG